MDVAKIQTMLDKNSSVYSLDSLTGNPNFGLPRVNPVTNTYNVEIRHENGNGEAIWGIFKTKLIELDANNPVGE